MRLSLFIPLVFVFFLLSNFSIYAQQPFDIVSTPNPPRAHSFSTLTLKSNTDLTQDLTNIRWIINGSNDPSFNDKVSAEVYVGGVGRPVLISVSALLESRKLYVSTVLYPISVSLLWEGKTHVPATYEGRALASPQAPLIASAIVDYEAPNGKRYDETDFVFSWSLNGVPQGGAKRGNSVLDIKYLFPTSDRTISFSFSNTTLNINDSEESSYTLTRPKLRLYENHPIYGPIPDASLGSWSNFSEPSIVAIVEPYFFSKTSVDGKLLDFEWRVAGETVLLDNRNISINAISFDGVSLSLDTKHKNDVYYLQRATYDTNLRF